MTSQPFEPMDPAESALARRIRAYTEAALVPIDAGRIATGVAAGRSASGFGQARTSRSLALGGRVALSGAIVLLLMALLTAIMASVTLVLGALERRPDRLPAPFGPARNGVIVMTVGHCCPGNLAEVEPETGRTVSLGLSDAGHVFSNDGRRLLFARPGRAPETEVLFVMNADGSGVREVLPEAPAPEPWDLAWAPDGNRILAVQDHRLAIHDIATAATLRPDLGIKIEGIQWRPNHDQIVIVGGAGQDAIGGLYLVNADGTGLRTIVPAGRVGPAFVSPDGATIAYSLWDGGRVHLLAVDTGVDRELTLEGSARSSQTPVVFAPAGNMQFSPDGTRLLISQEVEGPQHDLVLRQHGNAWEFRDVIVPVIGPGSAVVLGSDMHLGVGGPGGEAIFSPDGTQVLAAYRSPYSSGIWLFDVASGRGERPNWFPADGWGMDWQRLAP